MVERSSPERRTGAENRYRRLFTRGTDTERTVFFSDAVMAIAMTLLVLEIHIPDVAPAEIGAALIEDLPVFGAYVLSFAIIGVNWITHHRKFTVIRRYDSTLQWINLGFLFFIALLPVSTSALSLYQEPVTVVIYALNVAAISAMQLGLWTYAWRQDFLDEGVDVDVYVLSVRAQLPTPTIFLISIPVALLLDPTWAMYSWILILPVSIVLAHLPLPDRRRSERLVLLREHARTATSARSAADDEAGQSAASGS
jgi:uncharacterized membrane protein